jgi:hypothetical protein
MGARSKSMDGTLRREAIAVPRETAAPLVVRSDE